MVQTIETLTSATVSLEIPLGLTPVVTAEQFATLAAKNSELRLEMTADGELIIMAPAGSETGEKNAGLTGQIYIWVLEHKALGKVFDSSAGFTLPNGAIRSPDASWVQLERWNRLDEGSRSGFAKICPDVVIELRSDSDSLSATQEKMKEYLANGAIFGLLIDPRRQAIEIYRLNTDIETIKNARSVNFSEAMPGFTLNLSGIL
ncbi:MAG: hypothetical protein DCF15_06425 [Phormidesmis priestleyi]|uniref:Putative restriction endonuclease domain-containing protein n=1 Tax=Phormidesmis priestleyi TaxID=268141 RepID=A0A2W4XKA7_9CYAN|nr:MAG: hypothetical protein DCF15_06425 [Phormidesmis priestleyi]